MYDNNRGKLFLTGIIALLFIIVSTVGATLLINVPPKPVAEDAPLSDFSAERAMAIVEEISRKPHPLGSVENLRVEKFLLSSLEELGYESFVQDMPVFEDNSVFLARNVYARLKGRDSTGAIALCAHYDSVPYGPGAADDGAGVAAIIETARALKNSPPLRNDIIFLITDGEETGLLGPKTFLKNNPWRDDLKLVINYEARGHYGPSMMYLTWPGNRFTISNFIEASSYPVASSVMFDLADLLPTASDYYEFKEQGYPGFDLAFVGGLKYYHTPNDKPENLSMSSLQQHGLYGVDLTRHFGNLDLEMILENPHDRVVYFNTIGRHMVWYSTKWIWPITITALILIFAACFLGFTRGRIKIKDLSKGFAFFIIPFLAAPLLAILPVALGLISFGPYALYNQNWFFAGFSFLIISLFGLSYALAMRKNEPGALAMSPLILMAPLLIFTTATLPTGSFILAWPMLFSALGLIVYFLLNDSEAPWKKLVIGSLAAFPSLVLIAPQLLTLVETFTFLLGSVMLLLAGLMLGPAILLFTLTGEAPRLNYALPVIAGLLAAVSFSVAITNTDFSPEFPKMNYLLYGANYTEGTALYATIDQEPDEWSEQFFSDEDKRGYIHEFAPFYDRELRLAEAPLANIELGTINVAEDVTEDKTRYLSVSVEPGYETAEYYIWTNNGRTIKSIRFNGELWGEREDPPEDKWFGHIRGRFDEEVIISFELEDPDETFELTLVEQSYGLPDIPGISPRPDWMIPMTNTFPVSWNFSLERFLSDDPLSILEFEGGSRSKHIYARQDFSF